MQACKTQRRPTIIAALAAALLVCLAMTLGTSQTAWARVDPTDVIGGMSVQERDLPYAQAPDVECTYGILTDAEGNVLWARRPDDSSAMASITKIMTAVIVLEDPNMTPDTMITIPHYSAGSDESVIGLVEGSQVSVRDLVAGLMVHSGNDAAVALALAQAGSLDAFVAEMNEKAEQLGMTNTVFVTVNGLDEGDHHSCASDLVLLSRYAMRDPTFREVVSQPVVTISNGAEEASFESTNLLLGMVDGCEGIKTGHTELAGYCLTSAAKRDDQELFCVVLGCETEGQRFDDSQTLLEWGFKHYKPTTLAAAGTDAALVPCQAWIDKTAVAEVPEDVTVYVLDYNGPVDQEISLKNLDGKVRQGQVVGSVKWVQNDRVIATSDLVAQDDVPAPHWYESFSIWLRRVWMTIFGGQKVAEGQTVLPPVTIPAVTEA